MSQREFLQAFDGDAFEAFREAGFGDSAVYTSPGATVGVACTVLVDRGLRDYGDDPAPVAAGYTQITFQLREVAPAHGGRVVVDGETYVLDGHEEKDGSASRWVVLRA
ncbi:hypothetical protein BV378_14205 [Nostoc sp. RF31YmG]|jgi:hypothetical protein|nr:hypothetical protein BV378_14205 [Nostoc sp. RF31YmG]